MREVFSCRLCDSRTIRTILDFGETPLANSFVRPEDEGKFEYKAPLNVFQCENCGSVQLKHSVDPERLFFNYLYFSSTSKALTEHFHQYAQMIADKYLPENGFVVDIGGNDCALLRPLKNRGAKVLCVDPAKNIAETIQDIPFKVAFFTSMEGEHVRRRHGAADVVTANNMFAHVDNIIDIANGVKALLKDDGVFIFENAYLFDTIKGGYFDQVYSEHIYYHSVKPLIIMFGNLGMEVFKVERNDNQGGTIRVFVQKRGGKQPYDPSVMSFLQMEQNFGLYEPKTYFDLNQRIENIKINLHKLLGSIEEDGKSIVFFGAPAKLTTFCKVMGLNKKHTKVVIDDAKAKIGLLTPGTHIPIVPSSYLYEQKPDYCLITSWNFAEAIIKQNQTYLAQGGKFIIPLPDVRVISS